MSAKKCIVKKDLTEEDSKAFEETMCEGYDMLYKFIYLHNVKYGMCEKSTVFLIQNAISQCYGGFHFSHVSENKYKFIIKKFNIATILRFPNKNESNSHSFQYEKKHCKPHVNQIVLCEFPNQYLLSITQNTQQSLYESGDSKEKIMAKKIQTLMTNNVLYGDPLCSDCI